MKPKNILRAFLLGVGLVAAPCASAATYYWDGGIVDILIDGDGLSNGSVGNWNVTLLNWDGGASPHIAWSGTTDTAYFGGTAGTVTLGSDVTVGGITFDALSPGYAFSGGGSFRTITLGQAAAIDASGIGNFFTSNADVNWANGGFLMTVTSGSSATSSIAGVISGTGGLSLAGGTLQLSGANTYSGATDIGASSTLQLNGSGTLGTGGTYAGAIGSYRELSGLQRAGLSDTAAMSIKY